VQDTSRTIRRPTSLCALLADVVAEADVLEQLYAVQPEAFVTERRRLERNLRDEGRTEEAAEVAKLRKPSQPVFHANRLAREEPDLVARLVEDGERLAAAHQAGDSEQLRTVQRDLAGRVDALVRTAPGLSGAVEQRLSVLLRAAAINPVTATLLRRGVLSEEVEPTAFDALAGMTLAAPKPRQQQGDKPEPARRRKRRGRDEELEGKLAEATKALRQAERELRKAESDRDRAVLRVAQLTSRLEDTE
jgi:hypothetical protein